MTLNIHKIGGNISTLKFTIQKNASPSSSSVIKVLSCPMIVWLQRFSSCDYCSLKAINHHLINEWWVTHEWFVYIKTNYKGEMPKYEEYVRVKHGSGALGGGSVWLTHSRTHPTGT